MIEFSCQNCGHKLNVSQSYAGRSCICPKCENVVIIPSEQNTPRPESQDSIVSSQSSEKNLLNMQNQKEKSGLENSQQEQERKLPWLIDILLYPMSKPGLIILGLLIGIPLLIDMVSFVLPSAVSPGLLFMSIFTVVWVTIGALIKAVLGLYLLWYLCECVRDSTTGGLRAPETTANTPELLELFRQLLYVAACIIVFWLPACLYFSFTQKNDAIWWFLIGCGSFFFPIGLLAVIVFDSASGFNPSVWMSSIFSAFFQYCGLLLLFGLFGGIVAMIQKLLPQAEIFSYISRVFFVYLAIVAAHLLY